MYMSNLIAEIKQRVQTLSDTKTSTARTLRKEYSQKIKNFKPEEVLDLAYSLLELDGSWIYRFLAYELIHFHKPTLRSLGQMELEKLGQGMSDWSHVDTFAPYLSGVAWREGQIDDDVIHQWAHSENRWWRRAALVSTIALNTRARGGKGDVPRTLKVCELLADDTDAIVVKAVSWALRELIIWDPEAVKSFLNKHDEILAARIKREVRNKLETGLKNP
jgi:3-methyladenine DNA glycosylase AlkD